MNEEIADNRMGRVIQRVIEMETYRLMSLLSLPKVKHHSPALDKIETELRALTGALAVAQRQDDTPEQMQDADALLTKLTNLASDIEHIYSETSYRFSASFAYQDITDARIASLKASRLDGFQSIGGFLAKRMMPAIQSMTAFSRRMDHLSQRISHVAQLQRSQTELSLQKQNRDLLTSMNKRTYAQLRLQQTVEGLSMAALTYYGVGLVGYVAEATSFGLSSTAIKALSVPIVAMSVYIVIRRAKRAGGERPRLNARNVSRLEISPHTPSNIMSIIKLAPLSIIIPIIMGAPALAITLMGKVAALISPKWAVPYLSANSEASAV